MPQLVRVELIDDIQCITIDHPPVNALSTEVRQDLAAAVEAAGTRDEVKAVLILGAGKNFIGGADIREFGKPPQPPALPEVCNTIELLDKPVLAAIQGAALGGGLEVALAAHYRIASSDAKLGLPEVNLGLLPGAGGTQRTPRIIGAAAALELILSGRPIGAKQALELGLIDQLADGELQAAAIAYAKSLVANGAGPRRSRDGQGLSDRTAAQAAIDAAKSRLEKTARGLCSPGKIIETIQAALDGSFEEGLASERKAFLACMESPQRAGLIHMFFAEREVLKTPEARHAEPRPIHKVGVVGGGTMGAGIAVAALDGGLDVVMIERDAQALAAGRERVTKVYDRLLGQGRLSEEAKTKTLARYQGSTDYAALADVDLVIEAVFEDIEVKKAVFAVLDRVCKPGAVLASNTSYLDIDAIAASISRPQDVIGLHFFSPANIMRLLEVVVPAKVSPEVVATAFALAKILRKVPVRAGVCDGFIGNRILSIYRLAADYMLEDGASPYEIDAALLNFGFPMGPYQVADLAGGDIGWATRKRRAPTRDPQQRYVEIADRLCERGWFGQKTGRGYYLYPAGERKGRPDPEVEAIIATERQRAGITPRHFSEEEILRRYLAAMINEAANVLHDGIALRPLDIDTVFVYGYGFPRYRGGPLFYADQVGPANVLADIEAFAKEDSQFWKPSPLLKSLVAEGKRFADLNRI